MPALVASAFFGAICPTSFERKVYMNKRWLRRMDFTLIFAAVAIILMSLVIIGSATHINAASEGGYGFVQRQGVFALLNIALAVFLMNFDYKMLQRYGMKLYAVNIVLLLAVMLFGHSALGAQRWIQIGPVTLQPSEFSKVIMIISLAALLEGKVGKLNTLRDLLPIAAFVGVPFLLVLNSLNMVMWAGQTTPEDSQPGDMTSTLRGTADGSGLELEYPVISQNPSMSSQTWMGP